MKKSVSNVIKLLSLAMVAAFIMPETVKAQGGNADFSGTWTLNESKSSIPDEGVELGNRIMGGREFTVAQEANLLSKKSTGRDGAERTAKYTLDGKESVNTMGDAESKSMATWSDDGKSLTIKTVMEFNFEKRLITSVWSLPDAKTLSVVISAAGRDGTERKMPMVYDRK
jgi:hypothetical protein